MQVKGLDIARVRGLYPTLATRTAALDGSFAALQPESVIRAVISTLRTAPAQPGSGSGRSRQSAQRAEQACRAAADLVGARPEDVRLGTSVFSLLLGFATVLADDWQLSDEVVLGRLDADVAVRPWLRVAKARGGVVRWAEVDLETGDAPLWQYEKLINRRTRIVTVPLANPATGSGPDVAEISRLAHRHGALVVVDAGVAPCYRPIDLHALGADLLAVSAPVFGGPTVAALIARRGLLEEITGATRDAAAAHDRDLAPLPIELLDGFTAAVDHLAGLDEGAFGSRRQRIETSVRAAAEYTCGLYTRLDAGLRNLPGVTVLGGAQRAAPVAAFTVAGRSPAEVGAFLDRRDVSVWTGPSGMTELLRAFGADEIGGASFVGVMPHTTGAEIGQLLDALRALVAGRR